MTRALRALMALTLSAAPLAAQNPIGDRLLSMQGKPEPEQASGCKLSGGDSHVSSAATYFSTALSTPVDGNKMRALQNGHDQALQGMQNGSGSSKAWYYLARIYLQQGDLTGADSALTRLAQIAPACASEASVYRGRAWGSLMTAAVGMQHANHPDSMVFYSRAANQIDGARPQGWYTIGVHYLEAQQNDSAQFYLGKAFAAPSDTSAITQGVRQAAAYQYGVLAFNAHDFAEAARAFGIAVRLKADDGEARRNLAASLRKAGMADSAAKIEATMMGAAAGSDAGLATAQLMDIGVAQFNQHDLAGATVTFEKIVAAEPFNRDALFNLAQTYNAAAMRADSSLTAAQRVLTRSPRDTAALRIRTETTPTQAAAADKLLATALQLQAIDPLSFSALQLVGAGYRAKHDQPKVMATATALGGATVDVQMTGFAATATGAAMTLHAVGRDGRDINDRPVHGAPIPVVVEFLDKTGTVVASADATVPLLAASASQDIPVTGTGVGISAWRYHRK